MSAKPQTIVEALQSAHLALHLKAESRQRWTQNDQRAYEQVRAALTDLGSDMPVSSLIAEKQVDGNSGVTKSIILVTVLHPADESVPTGMNELAQYIDESGGIGQATLLSARQIPIENVVPELQALGNDGSFFNYLVNSL